MLRALNKALSYVVPGGRGLTGADSRAAGPGQVTDLERPKSWIIDLLGGSTSSGVHVNYHTSQCVTAVYACVRLRAESMAQLPLEVFERGSNGTVRKATEHPLYSILHDQPNKDMTSYTWRETSNYHIGLDGNAYSWIMYDQRGQVGELVLLDPKQTQVVRDSKDNIYYRSDEYGVTLLPAEVLHVKNTSYSGLKGLSPIAMHRETIGLGIAQNKYASTVFRNGAHIKGVVEADGRLTPKGEKHLRDVFNNLFSGVDNSGNTAVLEAGTTYKPIKMSPVDLDYVQAAKFSVEEVCRIYNIPSFMINSLDRATFNNIEHLGLNFVRYSLMPDIKKWEAEQNRKLLSPRDRKRYYTRYNVEGLLRGDLKSRTEAYRTLFYLGAINANEIRGFENWNPREGGDEYYVQSNMVAVDELLKQIKTTNNG